MNRRVLITLAAGCLLAFLIGFIFIGIGLVLHSRQSARDEAPRSKWHELIPETYWVIGPFGPGHDKDYEPERQPDPSKPCMTPDGDERKWVEKSIIPGAMCLDFRRAFGMKTTNNSAAYALV